jgi:hypothetical protein
LDEVAVPEVAEAQSVSQGLGALVSTPIRNPSKPLGSPARRDRAGSSDLFHPSTPTSATAASNAEIYASWNSATIAVSPPPAAGGTGTPMSAKRANARQDHHKLSSSAPSSSRLQRNWGAIVGDDGDKNTLDVSADVDRPIGLALDGGGHGTQISSGTEAVAEGVADVSGQVLPNTAKTSVSGGYPRGPNIGDVNSASANALHEKAARLRNSARRQKAVDMDIDSSKGAGTPGTSVEAASNSGLGQYDWPVSRYASATAASEAKVAGNTSRLAASADIDGDSPDADRQRDASPSRRRRDADASPEDALGEYTQTQQEADSLSDSSSPSEKIGRSARRRRRMEVSAMPTVLEGAESPGLSPDGASVGNTTCKSVSTAVSISAPTSHRHMEGMNFTSPSKPSVERSPWKAIHAQGDSLSGDSLSAESPSWQPPAAFMERSPVPPPDGWSASSRGPPLTVSPLLAGRSKLGEGRRRGERAPLCAPDAYMCAMRETLSTSPLAAAGKSLFRSASEP